MAVSWESAEGSLTRVVPTVSYCSTSAVSLLTLLAFAFHHCSQSFYTRGKHICSRGKSSHSSYKSSQPYKCSQPLPFTTEVRPWTIRVNILNICSRGRSSHSSYKSSQPHKCSQPLPFTTAVRPWILFEIFVQREVNNKLIFFIANNNVR